MPAPITQAQRDILQAALESGLTIEAAAQQAGVGLSTVKRTWSRMRAGEPVPVRREVAQVPAVVRPNIRTAKHHREPKPSPARDDIPQRVAPVQPLAYQLTRNGTIGLLIEHVKKSTELRDQELRLAAGSEDPYERAAHGKIADDYHKQMLDAIRLMAKCTGVDQGNSAADAGTKDNRITVQWLPSVKREHDDN